MLFISKWYICSIGKSNCYKDIIKGLKILQNRGYDSGICSLINGDFIFR